MVCQAGFPLAAGYRKLLQEELTKGRNWFASGNNSRDCPWPRVLLCGSLWSFCVWSSSGCRAYRSHDKCPSEKKKEQMPTINNTYVLLGTRVSWTLLATEKSGKSDGFHNFRNKEEDWTQWSDWLNDCHTTKKCTFKTEHTLNSQKETHALEVIWEDTFSKPQKSLPGFSSSTL